MITAAAPSGEGDPSDATAPWKNAGFGLPQTTASRSVAYSSAATQAPASSSAPSGPYQ